MLKKPSPCWVSERPKITPKAKWTPEEDEKLLELEEKFHGRWEDIPNEISHTPYECDVRCLELRQQMLRAKMQQHKGPESRNGSQLLSEALKEARNSVSESDSAQHGTVNASNSAALEATPEIDTAMTFSLRNTLESVINLSLDHLATDRAIVKLRECEEKVRKLHKEKDQLVKQKDLAIKEAHLRRAELGEVRDHVAFLEAAVVRAEEKQRIAEIEIEAKVMEQREASRLLDKQSLVAYICALEAKLQRNTSKLVSKALKKAWNSVSESDSAQHGTVAAANSAALEATPEIDTATTFSLRNTLESVINLSLDDLATDRAIVKLGECEEKVRELLKEKDQLVKQKDLAIKEAHLRRAELGKVKDHVAFLEAAVVRAEENQRNAEIEIEANRLFEKQFLVVYACALEAELQRTNTQQQIETREDFSKRHSADTGDTHWLIKFVESSFKDLDRPSKRLKISSNPRERNDLHFAGGSQGSIHPTNGAQWNDNQATVKATID